MESQKLSPRGCECTLPLFQKLSLRLLECPLSPPCDGPDLEPDECRLSSRWSFWPYCGLSLR